MEGFIKLHRKIIDNPYYFSEPFTRSQAWIDLLLLANHKPGFFYKRGIRVDVKRGEIGYDAGTLAKRWKWSRGKALRFFLELQNDAQIVQQKNNITTLISIVNYEIYQADGTAKRKINGTANGTANGPQTDTNKNDKEIDTKVSISWRESFDIYKEDCKSGYHKYYNDPEFIKEQQYFHPNLNIKKSILKAYNEYWSLEKGWKKRKSQKTIVLDWRATIINSLSQNQNKVYLTKQELAEL